MARPPKRPEEKQTEEVKVFLTTAEKQVLQTVAESEGRRMGDILRDGGMRYARRLRAARRQP